MTWRESCARYEIYSSCSIVMESYKAAPVDAEVELLFRRVVLFGETFTPQVRPIRPR